MKVENGKQINSEAVRENIFSNSRSVQNKLKSVYEINHWSLGQVLTVGHVVLALLPCGVLGRENR